jgi:glycosyltransferase involved in cell wall biosynthesis
MVVTEALARGVPVVASEVGGVPEALGVAPGGAFPGALVPPGDPEALSGALRRWLTDPGFREEARDAALLRRAALPGWGATVDALMVAVQGVSA